MTNGAEFASVVRRGRRAKTGTVVVHHSPSLPGDPSDARVGFVVSKAVGGSVVRKRVTRRLRAQLVPHLSELAAGSGTVVRALPAASRASSAELGNDLGRAFSRLGSGGAR